MMENFDAVTTDRRLTRELLERHLARVVTDPSLLLGGYVGLVSGGSSGQRGLFVQAVGEYAEFVASVTRRALAAALAGGRPAAGGPGHRDRRRGLGGPFQRARRR